MQILFKGSGKEKQMKTLIVIGMWIVGVIMIAIMRKVTPENNDWYPVWALFVCAVFTLSSLTW